MGVRVEGAIDAEGMLMTLDSTTKKRLVKKLIEKGKELRNLAIAMAPVDDGNLEKAIKMTPEEGGAGQARFRNDAGQFVRTEVEVYVDMSMPIPERPGKTVGDYAYEIHEHMTPMGHMNLGDKSNLKQLSSPGVEVGGGFMVRAADKIEEGLDAAFLEALNGLI